jgi:hypothetical protein
MVRFSDLLGGGGDNEKRSDSAAQGTISLPSRGEPTDPYAALGTLGDDAEPAEDATETVDRVETPEEILARLTEYARLSGGASAAVDGREAAEPDETDEGSGLDLDQPVADDLLPRGPRRKAR